MTIAPPCRPIVVSAGMPQPQRRVFAGITATECDAWLATLPAYALAAESQEARADG